MRKAETRRERRSHGAGTITEREPGVWMLRLSYGRDPDTGKRVREAITVHGTRRDAEKRLRSLLASKDAHQHPTRARKAMTTGACITDYLDNSPSLAPQTRERARKYWTLYASDRLRARPVRDLTPAFVESELQGLRDRVSPRTGRLLAPRTVGVFHGILRAGLERARKHGLLAANPAAGLDRPQEETRCHSARAMTLEQARSFLAVAEADDLAALWRLLVETAVRPGEATGMMWVDVPPKSAVVTVRHNLVQVGKDWRLVPPKTHQVREVVPSDRLAELLKEHRKRQLEARVKLGHRYLGFTDLRGQPVDLVFTDPLGRPLAPWVVTKAYKRLLRAAGLPSFRLYDLRHSCASLALQDGEDIADVSKLLGHARVSTTSDVYTHTSTASQRAFAERRARLFG